MLVNLCLDFNQQTIVIVYQLICNLLLIKNGFKNCLKLILYFIPLITN